MDSLINAAARALASGDPLGALNRVALRHDAPALALRGIAMAQLGDLDRAKALLKNAARAFGAKEPVSHARCIVAEAEIALVSRDLSWPTEALETARITLERYGDRSNAAHARTLEIRRLLLIGRLDQADLILRRIDPAEFPAALRAVLELAIAGIAMRRVRAQDARSALKRAGVAARQAGIAPLMAEVEGAIAMLNAPAARSITRRVERALRLDEVEELFDSTALIIDACRYVVREAGEIVSLATRPVLFALLRALAEAWPGDVSRDDLVRAAFGAREADESHRARLRVEIGRLRNLIRALAGVNATPSGFIVMPRGAREVVVLARPVDERYGEILALMADGEAWSSSSLALALDSSQRTVQRAVDALAADGKIQVFGRARARRWMTPPMVGIATTLLLPAPLADG